MKLHVLKRRGAAFNGFKFDNGPGRNRVAVEGWVVGEVISWIEVHKQSVLAMSGTLVGNVIIIEFEGVVFERDDERRSRDAGAPMTRRSNKLS